MQLQSFQDCLDYLNEFKPQVARSTKYGDEVLTRAKKLLESISNPQNKLKVIHVAGTSGKGSVATITASLLRSQGFKVGLTTSPHFRTIRERFSVNNDYISESAFTAQLKKLYPIVEDLRNDVRTSPSYFEIINAMVFSYFFEEGVDYAVVETGLGGLYDATNCVERADKVSVLTQIGFDHMNILGTDIPTIALQKAGIINQDSHVFAMDQSQEAIDVFKTVSKEKKSHIHIVKDSILISQNDIHERRFLFYSDQKNKIYDQIMTNLYGSYQFNNIILSLDVLFFLAKRDTFNLNEERWRSALQSIQLVGRFQTITKGDTTIIIDAAHNKQKMEAFVDSLRTYYPNELFDVLVGFKQDKNFVAMTDTLVPISNQFVYSEFFTDTYEMVIKAQKKEYVQQHMEQHNITSSYFSNPKEAFQHLINGDSKRKKVITGSIYLIGEILPLM